MTKKQKTVMMIGGGIQEVKAVEIAQSVGYKVIVTDRNKDAPCFSHADYTAKIDGRDIEGLIAYTLLNKEKLNIAGVFTLTELVTSVAAVANACGLSGVSLESAVACQNKQLCKKIWLKNKIQTPYGYGVSTFQEAKKLFKKLNNNIFIKPLVGFGGKDSQRVSSEDELKVYFSKVNNNELLIEEFLDGSMHDVNGLIDEKGTFHPMGIVDRFFLEKYPVEKAIGTPSMLSVKKQTKLYKLLEDSVKALGINWGPVKGDAILVDDNFHIFEVAPRLHGPKNSLYLLPYSGFNCLEKSLGTMIGKTSNNLKINQNHYSYFSAVLPTVGTLFNSNKIKKWKKNGEIIEHLIFKSNGEVINKYMNSTDVPAYIFIKGKSYGDCEKTLESLIGSPNGNNIK